jgi:DNA repair exonuclease SbcCD nuclease subunit
MKIAIITDMHIGRGNDSLILDDYFRKFYTDIFWPTLREEKITTIIDGGDLFDRRKFINFQILNNYNQYFGDEIRSGKWDFHSIVGNHNIYYNDKNGLNNLNLLVNGGKVYEKATEIVFDGFPILLVPWITKENYDHTIEAISKTKATHAIAHLELSGFEMDRGNMALKGMSKSLFEKFAMVYSGHYHHKNGNGNILYLGCPYEQTWADCNDPKGFHIFDTKDQSLRFIQNPYTIFKQWYYDDVNNEAGIMDVINNQAVEFENKFVKIMVDDRTRPDLFDTIYSVISHASPYEISVIDNIPRFAINSDVEDGGVTIDIDNDAEYDEDTGKIIRSYITGATYPSHIDKTIILDEMEGLYKEAQEQRVG